jgi:hypothetical protein
VTTGERSRRQVGRVPQIFGKATQTKVRRACDQLGGEKAAQLRPELFWRGDEQCAQQLVGSLCAP